MKVVTCCVLGLVTLIVSTPSLARAADAIDEALLAKSFTDVVAPDFDVVSHRIALLKPAEADSGTWLLMEVRPKRAGNFTLRCEWKTSNPRHPRDNPTERQEYFLVVADAGTPRFLCWQDDMRGPHPPACVGDTIIVAFAIPPNAKDVHFFREPSNPRRAAIWFEFEQEAAKEDPQKADFTVENGAAAHLIVQSKQASSSVSESGDFTLHASGVIFEAKEPGRFNLVASPKKAARESLTLPVVIVPKDQHLPVLATKCEHEQRHNAGWSGSDDHHELKTLAMRVGERVSLTCDEWMTRKNDPPQSSEPRAIQLTEKPFEAQAGSFGFTGLPDAPFAKPHPTSQPTTR